MAKLKSHSVNAEGQTANELTQAILNHLHLIGVVAWRNNTGAFRGKYETKSGALHTRFVKFGERGSGDVLGVVPPSGLFISIEVKVGSDTLRDSQEKWMQRIEAAGGIGVVAHSLQDVIDAIRDLRVSKPQRQVGVTHGIASSCSVTPRGDAIRVIRDD